MTRKTFLLSAALPCALFAVPAIAQDLQPRTVSPPPLPPAGQTPASDEEITFSAGTLEYDKDDDIVTASGDVRMFREGNRLRADRVTWNRTTGKVLAEGNVAVVNPGGDTAYGDKVDLTDTLRDGVVENLLVVLDEGGRLAAVHGSRSGDIYTLDRAAYSPCPVTDASGCPRQPTWKITAVNVTYDAGRKRVRYKGARLELFGVPLNSIAGTDAYGRQPGSVRHPCARHSL